MPMISAVGVEKTYGEGVAQIAALASMDIVVTAGEFLMVTGPSGSGKSTLLAILSGLLQPSRGHVEVMGRNLSASTEKDLDHLRLHQFGFIFQGFHLLPFLTSLEQVAMLPERQGLSKAAARTRALEALEGVGLGHRLHSLPEALSGGEKQRVAIARALAKRPQIIFADEPTSALDSVNGGLVADQLRAAALRQGATVVCVTHDARLMTRATRLVQMEDGRLRAAATPDA
ncbi:ABC transporter ATP-binding protein [Phenylobacterium sp.]|uniref:ABC transporter ATP-binding protein n=1 Tax=Phenylobacterium sp. TaxID=1871053 RepID=UPI003BAB3A06